MLSKSKPPQMNAVMRLWAKREEQIRGVVESTAVEFQQASASNPLQCYPVIQQHQPRWAHRAAVVPPNEIIWKSGALWTRKSAEQSTD
jgi:hypothetical protein